MENRVSVEDGARMHETYLDPTNMTEVNPGPSRVREPSPAEEAAHSTNSGDDAEHEAMVCPVCRTQPATANLNFGGRSCVNCRVFFSRVVIAAKSEDSAQSAEAMAASLRCRCQEAGGRRVKYKTECKRCRFKKCLRAGLSPDKVKRRTRSVKSRKQAALQAAAAAAAAAAEAEPDAASLAAATATVAAVNLAEEPDNRMPALEPVAGPSSCIPVAQPVPWNPQATSSCLWHKTSPSSSPDPEDQGSAIVNTICDVRTS